MANITQVHGHLGRPDFLAGVRELAVICQQHDGVPPLSDASLIKLDNPQLAPANQVRHLLLGALEDTELPLAGYAVLDLGDDPQNPAVPATAELMVHPRYRRQGLGTALISELHALVKSQGKVLHLWSHGDSTAAREVALASGLQEVRDLWQMRRDLTVPLPTLPPHPAWRLATFRPGKDDAPWLSLNAAAFAHHPEQGQVTAADLQALQAETWFDPAGFFLLSPAELHPNLPDADGPLAGFVWTKVHPASGEQAALGEVYVIGISPDYQGQGLGKLLTLHALHYLKSTGVHTAMLYVDATNTPAVQLYRNLGFSRYTVDVMYSSVI